MTSGKFLESTKISSSKGIEIVPWRYKQLNVKKNTSQVEMEKIQSILAYCSWIILVDKWNCFKIKKPFYQTISSQGFLLNITSWVFIYSSSFGLLSYSTRVCLNYRLAALLHLHIFLSRASNNAFYWTKSFIWRLTTSSSISLLVSLTSTIWYLSLPFSVSSYSSNCIFRR